MVAAIQPHAVTQPAAPPARQPPKQPGMQVLSSQYGQICVRIILSFREKKVKELKWQGNKKIIFCKAHNFSQQKSNFLKNRWAIQSQS